ncbi:MAG: ferrous iron transporter B, partial [Clostridia bacterium]|nr:ferrous iron transporter B [Clostridia bacterium]
RIDKLLSGGLLAFPAMLCLLAGILWLTITGANYPSRLLSGLLFGLQDKLMELCRGTSLPPWLYEMLLLGVYRVVAWVVAVMLPPMAIFFPLFTLLEDLGYLPRVAFNLDRCFKGCRACGKQALTMCMGFGCNAVGVTGCRIIDSPRERLIAIITNSFVPCNGRFPTLIAIISMFFASAAGGLKASVTSALLLTAVILLGILMTFGVSRLLSQTLLKGMPSSFTLELPPYRPPQIGRVIVRSVLDRTVFVLGRAVSAAAPAGLVIWLMANLRLDGVSLLSLCADLLDPFARLLGLDGVILMAFVLGFPANEIVIPVMLMAYTAQSTLADYSSLEQLRLLLLQNGWNWTTAVSMLLFSLMHWPCATTCLTIKKETGSLKWTLVSFAAPTLTGMALCFLFNMAVRLIIP